jgi:hypothetical protein
MRIIKKSFAKQSCQLNAVSDCCQSAECQRRSFSCGGPCEKIAGGPTFAGPMRVCNPRALARENFSTNCCGLHTLHSNFMLLNVNVSAVV